MTNNDREFLVQKIRTQYTEREQTGLDRLKKLDAEVKRPARCFAYIFGSIGAIVMGSGMSLVMTEIGASIGIAEPLVPGIAVGLVGLLMAAVNYPIYKKWLGARRKKYAEQVIALSDEVINQD